jgi:outer membrane protein OmpA-like peptidoglycan-associated protein
MNYKVKVISLFVVLFSALISYTQTNTSKKYTRFTDYEVVPIYGLNTMYNEFSPVLYKQNFVFISDREYDLNTLGEGNWEKTIHVNIFKADFENIFNDSVVLEKINLFDHLFLTDDHIGPIVFNKEGTEAIVTIVTHKNTKVFAKSVATPQLYIAKNIEGKWQSLESLPFNNPNHSLGQPAWSPDGSKLYFALNKKPGVKESDIYFVERNGDQWGSPSKVSAINSKSNEMFPYLIEDKIYFSSDRSEGFGGLDLYVSELVDDKWSEPKNLGKTINTEADEFSMVFNVNKTSGYFSSNRVYGKGKDDIYAFNKIDKTIVENPSLDGQLTYRHLKGKSSEGLEMGMYDEDGNLIARAKVGADGKFTFKNIPSNTNYTLKAIGSDEEMELILFDENEDIVLVSDSQGNFIYRKLSSDKVGTIALIDDEDLDLLSKKGELSGQFVFKKLKSDGTEGMEVYLVDEDGNIFMKTKTDEYGNFVFKNIPSDGNYTLKAEDNDDFDLLVFNKKNQLLARLKKDKNGNFVFRKLKSNGNNSLTLGEDDLLFLEKRVALTGQFIYQKIKSNVGSLDVEVHDQQEQLKKVKSTKEGDFMAVGLKVSDQYKFRITDESKLKEEPILNITNRYHQTVAVLNRDDIGFYVFNKSEDFNLGDSVVNIEVIQIEQTVIQDTVAIYYKNNEFTLSADDRKVLGKRLEELKADQDLLIRIESYASSKGSVEYNKELTLKRKAKVLQYFTTNGIHESRIKAFSYGEVRTQEEQDEEQQRLNRKTELTVFKLK